MNISKYEGGVLYEPAQVQLGTGNQFSSGDGENDTSSCFGSKTGPFMFPESCLLPVDVTRVIVTRDPLRSRTGKTPPSVDPLPVPRVKRVTSGPMRERTSRRQRGGRAQRRRDEVLVHPCDVAPVVLVAGH